MFGADAAHRVHHLLAQLHGGRQRFGVSPQNVPEINVEQLAVLCEQQVVQVSVSDTQQVGYDAVAGARLHVGVHDVGHYAVRAVLLGVVLLEVVLDTA